MNYRVLSAVTLLLIFAACGQKEPGEVAQQLETFKEYDQPDSCRAEVYVFLQPDCPLSQDQTRTLAKLVEDPALDDFCFTAFFSGSLYRRSEFEEFILRYPTPYEIKLDPELAMAKELGATVVPEVFVTNSKGEMLYQGAIDDWAVREGSKRDEPQKHYLKNALKALAQGEDPPVAKTEAVGCILE